MCSPPRMKRTCGGMRPAPHCRRGRRPPTAFSLCPRGSSPAGLQPRCSWSSSTLFSGYATNNNLETWGNTRKHRKIKMICHLTQQKELAVIFCCISFQSFVETHTHINTPGDVQGCPSGTYTGSFWVPGGPDSGPAKPWPHHGRGWVPRELHRCLQTPLRPHPDFPCAQAHVQKERPVHGAAP